MENNELVIIIQGPSSHVDTLKNAWEGFNIIWSTWKGEENKYNDNDNVIFNDKPNIWGVGNICLQQKTIISGLNLAKKMKYKKVLKWRSDMVPKNPSKLVSLFKDDCINWFFFHNVLGGYFVDYFMEGDLNMIENIWSFTETHDEFAEKILTKNVNKFNYKNNFVGREIDLDNDIFWIKKNLYLSTYNNHKDFIVKE